MLSKQVVTDHGCEYYLYFRLMIELYFDVMFAMIFSKVPSDEVYKKKKCRIKNVHLSKTSKTTCWDERNGSSRVIKLILKANTS